MSKTAMAIIAVVLVLALFAFSSYNSLVNLEEAVDSRWSQVENQLQRRSDLIPNLVATVKGYAAHEEAVFAQVNEARAKLAGAQSVRDAAQADAQLSGALSRLLAVVENYPNLKADANFRQLQDELAGTENRIAVARMDYNNAVQRYNAAIRRFPTVIFARLLGFTPREYFQAEPGAREAPQVNFGAPAQK
ncbi:MAG: LemA protein [Bacillota bacterium]|nr:LemA protein [Bacillota bacterium]MDK2855686.1 LemA protein [Bacillota bacterium]MDK2924910.1 LemA protein [Bacillota bacterium]